MDDTVRLTDQEALALCVRVLSDAGYSPEQAHCIGESLVDAELCGYPSLGLARAITIAEDARTRKPRSAPRIERDNGATVMVDGGNNAGPLALTRAVDIGVQRADEHGVALVGVFNTYLSGRSAYYIERITRAGCVGMLMSSSQAFVVAPGGSVPVVGTNPIAIGIPARPDPVVFDMSTASIGHGDVVLAARLGDALPPDRVVSKEGWPTTNAEEALQGGILPFGGHKGFGLALMVQMLSALAGSMRPEAHVKGYGFLFVIFRTDALLPQDAAEQQLAALMQSWPTEAGVRMPSARAFALRADRLQHGLLIDRRLFEKLRPGGSER